MGRFARWAAFEQVRRAGAATNDGRRDCAKLSDRLMKLAVKVRGK